MESVFLFWTVRCFHIQLFFLVLFLFLNVLLLCCIEIDCIGTTESLNSGAYVVEIKEEVEVGVLTVLSFIFFYFNLS